MAFYPTRLSENHQRELFEDSDISPDVAQERSYRTVSRSSELLCGFKGYQRGQGLHIPTYSPDGMTTSAQLKRNAPRKNKKGDPLKYETPGGSKVILDVHPRIRDEVRSGEGDLFITEGIKKADSLTSRGLPTIGLIGVWNWQRDGELLPCWDHIRLYGRRVYIVFDSDVMTKENVQLALQRLVAALEARGADVRVVYLSDSESGEKVGVDDYLVAGGTVAQLKALARKFEPEDLGRIRLSRDEHMRAGVEDLEHRFWDEEWKDRGGHSDRDVAHQFIGAAARNGKIHPDGIRVEVSWGVLQVGAKVTRRTLAKSLARLEERGFLYRDNEGRKADKTGAFVLRAKVDQYGERTTPKGKVTQELQECDPGGLPLRALPDVPRLRWSQPKYTPKKRGFVRGTRKIRESKPLPAREGIERLGKVRGAIVDALVVAGGELTLQKLCGVLNKKRPRDVRRRVLPMLEEAGVIEVAGDVVRLAGEWREALESERRDKGEVEADALAEDRRKRKSRAFHERDKPLVSKPSAAGLAAVQRSQDKRAANIPEHEEHQAKARAAELEHRQFVKRFVYERLQELGRIRLELLQEVLKDAGGTPAYALPAAKSLGCTIEKLPEFGDREFVFAPQEWGEKGAA